ncbi:hypothetical protein [Thalassococcus lentus]|uniref:DUF3887 domain-containing protein n=1 Tax=Thalassococcus lentus TaxID=1210524 RepID=A0ABT4XQP5_9RHOB|nr:hypothetical protein [Thalassococcus lentus]MDA7424269.1 hypothetical protein [Thalassococcus lentus]
MRSALLTLPFAAMLLASPVAAQQPDSVFNDYADMRAQMDELTKTRNIQQLMLRFGGADEMTTVQLDNLDAQVEQIYAVDFEQVSVLRRTEHDNGFYQELLAYWTGLNYLYVYVFYHERDGKIVAINFRFNSDFNALNNLF